MLAKGEPMFRTALAILGNEADARDATQETFIAVVVARWAGCAIWSGSTRGWVGS